MQQNRDWRLSIATQPVLEPVSPDEFRDAIRFSATELDATIERNLATARRQLEIDTQRALLTQTWELRLDFFPDDLIELRKLPVLSVTSITYTDTSGNSQTLATTVYATDIYSTPPRITLKQSQSWPATYSQANVVTVTFVAGYGATVETVPAEVKDAIIVKAATYFEDVDRREQYEQSYMASRRYLDWAGYR